MGSSAMSLSKQHHVDTVKTVCSTRPVEKVTVSHIFKIMGYSLENNAAKEKYIQSTVFEVDGYNWTIEYYPGGCTMAQDDYASIYFSLHTQTKDVKAQAIFTVPDQTGSGLPTISMKTSIVSFKSGTIETMGLPSFAKRKDLNSRVKDDCLTIEVVVTVFKVHAVEQTAMIVVPSVNIQDQFGLLLKSGIGADVTFEVKEKKFSAHKCILAARSSVFSAQFFGSMKEKSDTIIKIEEMEPLAFEALLYFIYNDSFPTFEETDGCEERNETQLLAQHLIVAADKYDLERLRIMCEKILSEGIDEGNVITLLSIAERHTCNHLRAACVKFLGSPGILQRVAATQLFTAGKY